MASLPASGTEMKAPASKTRRARRNGEAGLAEMLQPSGSGRCSQGGFSCAFYERMLRARAAAFY